MIALILLSMYIVASVLISCYRNVKMDNKKKLNNVFFVLSIIVALKIVEVCIPVIEIGFAIRCFNSVTIIVLLLKIAEHMNRNVFSLFELKGRYINFTMFLLFGLMIITKGHLIITDYDFFQIRFNGFYKGFVVAVASMVFLYMIFLFHSKKRIHSNYSNSLSKLILIVFLLTPVLIYVAMIVFETGFLDFADIVIYMGAGVVLNFILYSRTYSELTAQAFDKIGDIIQDYVFITDVSGQVIYKNRKALQSDLFVQDNKLDIANIKKLYKIEPQIKNNIIGSECVMVEIESGFQYFKHHRNYLKDDDKTIGYIITVIDITDLMKIIHDLEEKKQKSKEMNDKLKSYSEVVYYIEKEKEINKLLEEILSSREKDMQSLISMIGDLAEDKSNFKEKVEETILFNQKILEEVRKTVSVYRRYYGN
jgi:hypothetical protein